MLLSNLYKRQLLAVALILLSRSTMFMLDSNESNHLLFLKIIRLINSKSQALMDIIPSFQFNEYVISNLGFYDVLTD